MLVHRKGEKTEAKKDSRGKGVFRITESSMEKRKIPESSHKYTMHANEKTDDERTDLDIILFWVAVAASQIIGMVCLALVVYWCLLYGGFSWNRDANLQFFVHPLLMVLGLILFYGDAILVYRVLYFLPKWYLKLIHAGLHLGAIILSSIGLIAVFENHRRTNKADLYSLHSWVGILTFGFFCLQYVGSFITFLYPGLPPSIRSAAMPFHTFFGIAVFALAVATAQMGLTERLLWTNQYTSGNYTIEGTVGNSLGIFLIIFAILVVFLTTRTLYKRRPLPSEIAPTN